MTPKTTRLQKQYAKKKEARAETDWKKAEREFKAARLRKLVDEGLPAWAIQERLGLSRIELNTLTRAAGITIKPSEDW